MWFRLNYKVIKSNIELFRFVNGYVQMNGQFSHFDSSNTRIDESIHILWV